jgi:hypothetical protein
MSRFDRRDAQSRGWSPSSLNEAERGTSSAGGRPSRASGFGCLLVVARAAVVTMRELTLQAIETGFLGGPTLWCAGACLVR